MTQQERWVTSRYTSDDAQDCLQLVRAALGETGAADSSHHEWQCQRSPAGAAIGSLARETETGRLIGQVVTIPMRVRLSGKVRIASLCLNAAIDSAYQPSGVLPGLLNDLSALSAEERIAFTYGSPSQASHWPIMEKAGFKNIGAVPLLLRPLNPESLATKTAHGHPPAKAASIARRVWRTAAETARLEALPGLDIAEVDYFDGSFEGFWEKVQHRFSVMIVRDPTYLNWRFVDVPQREYTAFVARSEGEIRGITVLRAAPLGHFSAGLIAELVVEASAEGRAAGRLLIDRAHSHFRDQDLDLLASLALRHTDEFRLLRSMGFWVCPKFLEPRPFRLFVRAHEEEGAASRLAYDLNRWFVTMGDFAEE
jgi:N-acetylglutamate synthase-like GNAT family acetyltransferase